VDGREGIFDFVGDAAATPARQGFLRGEHFGEVVEDEKRTHVAREGGELDGGGEVEDAPLTTIRFSRETKAMRRGGALRD